MHESDAYFDMVVRAIEDIDSTSLFAGIMAMPTINIPSTVILRLLAFVEPWVSDAFIALVKEEILAVAEDTQSFSASTCRTADQLMRSQFAVSALIELSQRSPDVKGIIAMIAREGSEEVRAGAVYVAGLNRDDSVINDALRDESPLVRRSALRAIQEIRSLRSERILRRLNEIADQDASSEVVSQVKQAIQRIENERHDE